MYKYLLCWRYLRHRYIALASVLSVMLGVATMIVVNSVMAGFADKMRERLKGVLSDVVVESYDLDGFWNSEEVMARIKQVAGDDVVAMARTMETFGLMKWTVQRAADHPPGPDHRHRPEERAQTGDFSEFLFADQDAVEAKPPVRMEPSFAISEKVKRNRPIGRLLDEEPQGGPMDGLIRKQHRGGRPRLRRDHRLRRRPHPRPAQWQGGRHRHRPARDAGRPGLPRRRGPSPSRGTTTSRSSATSRAA